MVVNLSEREREVIKLWAWGANEADIATDLHIARSTVKTHLSRIRDKLCALTSGHAVTLAIKYGFLTITDIYLSDTYVPTMIRSDD